MATPAKILVVDDEESIRFFLEETLTRDGHHVVAVASGEAALERIAAEEFDLALIDLMMPGMGGMKVLAALRKRSPDTTAIMLTGHGSLETAVESLRQGAHDYLFKPANIVELRESVRTGLIKRWQKLRQRDLLAKLTVHLSDILGQDGAMGQPQGTIPIHPALEDEGKTRTPLPTSADLAEDQARFLNRSGLIVDLMRHVTTLDGQVLELSPTEFALVAYLASEAPRVVSPQELVHAVQGYECEPWEASEMLRYHIHRIRQKAKQAAKRDIICTVRGIGYTISDQ